MSHSAVLAFLWWQVAEGSDRLLRIPVDHHLSGTAEKQMQITGFLLTRIGDVGCQFRSQINTEFLDDRTTFSVYDGKA